MTSDKSLIHTQYQPECACGEAGPPFVDRADAQDWLDDHDAECISSLNRIAQVRI